MKNRWIRNALSWFLAGAMTLCLTAAAGMPATVWAEEKGGGKYVGDVFIAYGKTEEEAAQWLKDNGWEPVEGDFNAGKASFFDDNKVQDQNVAAVMGIKRTDEKNQAVTDMAVMNMTGGYSFPQYEELVEQKKTEINEFINNFRVVIDEYRANYNGEGSELGQQRAQIAHDMLNKFYDGDPKDTVAANDTGMSLGDLFLESTRQEGNEKGGDLEQLMLESSGAALLVMETFLALGADTGEDTWLQRASGLTGDELSKNLPKYVPEAEGKDVADSEVAAYLNEKYGDTAAALAEQWTDINEAMTWYEAYNEENGLWPKDGESEDAYAKRQKAHFDTLIKDSESDGEAEKTKYLNARALYDNLYEVAYVGDWGDTLGDFFNPADAAYNNPEADSFLPLAAGLSAGQAASMDFLSLRMLLLIGFGDKESFEKAMPDIQDLFGDETELSIYTGVKREAFRGGVAITSEAEMDQNAGKGQAFDQIWDNTGIVAMASYAAAAVGAVSLIAGSVMAVKGIKYTGKFTEESVSFINNKIAGAKGMMKSQLALDNPHVMDVERQNLANAQAELAEANKSRVPTRMGIAGRWMLGIGGVLLVGAAIVKGVQMWQYYERTMKPIPRMIVDESDVVTYLTDDNGKPLLDENGKQKKNIDFKTYEYYSAVKCNRPDIGEIGDWQDGVAEYKDHNCDDIADLNADMGQEWIALYTVKSQDKGDPILADSLTLQYGSKDMPEGCSNGLHLFTYTNAVDLGDTAWAFNNAKEGVYFFWDADEKAFAKEAASAFGTGQMALAGIGGLILGIAATTLVLTKKRRKDEPEAA